MPSPKLVFQRVIIILRRNPSVKDDEDLISGRVQAFSVNQHLITTLNQALLIFMREYFL